MKWIRGALVELSLVTVAFAAVSVVFARRWMSWAHTSTNLSYTVLVVPATWFVLSGRKRPLGLVRAMFAGGVSGMLSQLAMHAPFVVALVRANLSGGVHGEDLASGFESFFYMWIGLCSTVIGAILGLFVVLVERWLQASRARRVSTASKRGAP